MKSDLKKDVKAKSEMAKAEQTLRNSRRGMLINIKYIKSVQQVPRLINTYRCRGILLMTR